MFSSEGGGFEQVRNLIRVASSQQNSSYSFLTDRPGVCCLLISQCGDGKLRCERELSNLGLQAVEA